MVHHSQGSQQRWNRICMFSAIISLEIILIFHANGWTEIADVHESMSLFLLLCPLA